MPYIPKDRRKELWVSFAPETPGELNYMLTRLAVEYIKGEYSYGVINDVIGALEGAKLELYRRVAAPYEDDKRESNGDVY